VVLASEKYVESEKVVRTFFEHCLFQQTLFVKKKVLYFVKNCPNILIFSQSAIFNQKTAHFFHKNGFFFKCHYQKMFGPLYSESAYFSDAKNTFEMFGMICFGVDSQTHTPVCKTYSTSCRLCRHHQLRAPAPLQLCPPSQAARQLVL
jgi:hypothetical protein